MGETVHDRKPSGRLQAATRSFDRLWRMGRKVVWGSTWRAIRLGAVLRWSLSPYRGASGNDTRRALIIYDFGHQPISIGDLLMTRVAAEVFRQSAGVGFVDVAFLYEPDMQRHADPDLWHVDASKLVSTVGRVMQAVQIEPTLGSISIFNSRAQLERYVAFRAEDTLIWPGPAWYAAGQYVYYSILNDLLYAHFQQHGSVPELKAGKDASDWARSTVEATSAGRRPITVQLRMNPHNTARNSQFEAWREFLQRCGESDPDCMFYLIGDRCEQFDLFQGMPNVVVAGDLDTSLDRDLALIEAGHAHLGASSGPGTVAVFSPKPYAMFGWQTADYRYRGLIVDGGIRRFYFANINQRLVVATETAEILSREWTLIRNALAGSAHRATARVGHT